jgi:hypothetical protein
VDAGTAGEGGEGEGEGREGEGEGRGGRCVCADAHVRADAYTRPHGLRDASARTHCRVRG